jgi:hypothetical protein
VSRRAVSATELEVLRLSVVAQADLSGAFNQVGAVADGTTFAGGLDGNGDAYSAGRCRWRGGRRAGPTRARA